MTNFNDMTDQELAERAAKEMGWTRESDGQKNLYYIEFGGGSNEWKPCDDYNDCRVFEDFLQDCEMKWHNFNDHLNRLKSDAGILHSAARERMIAGLMAIEEIREK